jgi:2,3-bisphosphoglycerate-dependent phosphoglycerate mutase
MENDTLEITLLRHGRSRADDEEVHEGRYDSPLTEVGQTQALARAEGWKQAGVSFDLAVCSTLQRARTVAEIITGLLNIPLVCDPDWMEVDHGPLAGLSYEEGKKRYPPPVFRNPYERIAGSGESEIGLQIRAARAIEALVQRGPGRYLVVAHGGILNAALRVITGAPTPVNHQGIWFHFDDLGYARLTYTPPRHRWVLKEFKPGL